MLAPFGLSRSMGFSEPGHIPKRGALLTLGYVCWRTDLPPFHCYKSLAPLEIIFRHPGSERKMLWTILVILVVLWLLGLIGNVGGNLIHLLLVVAVIVLIYNLVTGRRSV